MAALGIQRPRKQVPFVASLLFNVATTTGSNGQLLGLQRTLFASPAYHRLLAVKKGEKELHAPDPFRGTHWQPPMQEIKARADELGKRAPRRTVSLVANLFFCASSTQFCTSTNPGRVIASSAASGGDGRTSVLANGRLCKLGGGVGKGWLADPARHEARETETEEPGRD